MNAKGLDVLPKKDCPEIDISEELGSLEASYIQSLIGILRCIFELKRVDICNDTSMMSSHLALPRRGHLKTLFHMFSYLKKHQKLYMLFDPIKPDVDMADFQLEVCGFSIYGNVK